MNGLQLFSFIINEENVDDINLKVFKLPETVKNCIQTLSETGKDGFSYKSIFKVATALFDKVLYSNNSLYEIEKNNGIWFYAVESFDLELFKVKITQWLEIEFKNKDREFNESFEEEWKFDEDISLKKIMQSSSIKYNLIPQYYIYKLSKYKYIFNSIDKELEFNRVIGDSSATMMTMPIKVENKVYTPFSYFITSEMKKPIEGIGYTLNFKIHIRVWCDKSIVKEERLEYKYRKGATVYVYKENDYYIDNDILFNKVEVKNMSEDNLTYKNKADDIFVKSMELSLLDVIKEPLSFMENKQEVIGLIINNDKGHLLTQSGAGLPERNEMLKLLVDRLPKLKLRQEIERIASKSSINKMDNNKKIITIDDKAEDEIAVSLSCLNKQAYVPNSLYSNIEIYIATNNKELYEKARGIVIESLGLEKIDDDKYISNSNYSFKIIQIGNDFTRVLDNNEDSKRRIKEVEAIIDRGEKGTLKLALVEIDNYHEQFGFENRDPKNSIRVAFKNKAVLTQFINYDKHKEAAVDSVIYNSLKDLFSTAGFTEGMIYDIKGLNQDDILVGISKISTGDNENILCMSKIVNRKIFLNIYNINNWMPIEEYIFKINSMMINKSLIQIKNKQKEVSDSTNRWICDELSVIAEEHKRVLCFVDVDVRNKLWSFAKNDSFVNIGELRIPNIDNITFIRINSDGNGEVPEYFIYDGKDNINKVSGVFKGENSTYYLVGRRIGTDQIPKGITKCRMPNKPLKRPSIYEINIQGHISEGEKDTVAKITQDLRSMNISYDSHASLPLPLYCTKRLTEYIRAEKSV